MVRRRHRTWMLSMTFASLGWGAWWIFLFLTRVAPEHAPTSGVIQWIGVAFALPGFAIAVWTVRAKLAWIVVTLVPLCANGSLLAMPLVMKTIRVIRAERAQNAAPQDAERETLGELRTPSRS
jgi:hypothetical protein